MREKDTESQRERNRESETKRDRERLRERRRERQSERQGTKERERKVDTLTGDSFTLNHCRALKLMQNHASIIHVNPNQIEGIVTKSIFQINLNMRRKSSSPRWLGCCLCSLFIAQLMTFLETH